MTDKINDGGPAFPLEYDGPSIWWEGTERTVHTGISLRDYLAAHAPDKPAPWFEPQLPERPSYPSPEAHLSPEQLKKWKDEWADHSPDKCDEEMLEFDRQYQTAHERIREWDNSYRARARYVQWPYAWADAMLKEREHQS